MRRPLLLLFFISIFWGLASFTSEVFAAPLITSISDNRNSYANGSVPTYKKFEITFQIQNTVASNLFTYFEQNLPPGVRAHDNGITVNAYFLPPGLTNWNQAYIQPAFFYHDFDYKVSGGRDWLYPNGNNFWKVRFSPNAPGTWQYRLEAQDASGSSQSQIYTFNAVASSNPGFIKVASGDRRYFEFENGSYFPGLGYNQYYRQIDWVNPIQGNQSNLSEMHKNGIQLIRIWLSQWSIFGSGWNPWKSVEFQDGDPPWEMLLSNVSEYYHPEYEVSLLVPRTHNQSGVRNNSCVFYDSYNSAPIAVKPNTTYQVKVSYYPKDLVGSGGFVVKIGVPQYGDHRDCEIASPITDYVRPGTPPGWKWLTGTFTTGNNNFLNGNLYLHMEGITSGETRVGEVIIQEMVNGNPVGPNILYKPKMDHLRYVDQRNSFAFDKVLELAEQNGVYFRVVIMDHREWIMNHTRHDGQPTDDYSGGSNPPGDAYLYGPTNRSNTKNRFYQKSWYRYLQARWGYSTSIHNWEFVNEGTTGLEHAVAADIMGEFFEQFKGNHHLTAASTWSQTTSTAQAWNLSNYPHIDFVDIHHYIPSDTEPSQYYDTSEATIYASNRWGAQSSGVHGNWPVIRGETGLNSSSGNTNTFSLEVTKDTKGVWLHNFLWAQLNSNALIESYWWASHHIYCQMGSSVCLAGRFDNRPHFKPLYDFVSNIPLNKGGYQDLAASGYNSSQIRVVGQKNTSALRAHGWIQNKKHTWCAFVGGIPNCPQTWDGSRLSGSVTFGGFPANRSLPIEWWYFDANVNLTKLPLANISTDANGNITLNLNNLPANVSDVGFKIGNYSAFPSGTPVPTQEQGSGDADNDGDVDINDYLIWFEHYLDSNLPITSTSDPDFNNNGKIDGEDFIIWAGSSS